MSTKRSLVVYEEPIDTLELHSFGDESRRGVAALVYAVVKQASGVTQGLVAAKFRARASSRPYGFKYDR